MIPDIEKFFIAMEFRISVLSDSRISKFWGLYDLGAILEANAKVRIPACPRKKIMTKKPIRLRRPDKFDNRKSQNLK